MKTIDLNHILLKWRVVTCTLALLCCTNLAGADKPLRLQDADKCLSLLTCGPGDAIYTLFGHTAIRYRQPSQGVDVVFNYGMFDFSAPNFILRFTLGETDYQLGVTDFDRFMREYAFYGRCVVEQELNLSDEQAERLISQLEENYRPGNRVYRYNFFYDNCATRPRDQIERAIGTLPADPAQTPFRLRYADDLTTATDSTYRDLLHRYTEGHPWARFGIDLCMGREADRPINRRQMMFVPFYVERYFSQAQIEAVKQHASLAITDTAAHAVTQAIAPRPLVAASYELLPQGDPNERDLWDTLTPGICAWTLLILVVAVSFLGFRMNRMLWGLDIALFTVAGVAGCIIAFLMALSQHPCVGSNFMILLLHPFHLLCLPCMIRKLIKGRKSLYMGANIVILTCFITFWALGYQDIPSAALPLALCLYTRSISNLLIVRKRQTSDASSDKQ